jgi:16S rRNA (cytosine1407-C5)-methyltransferase
MSKEHFPVFLERLKVIVGRERYDQVVQSFSRPDFLSVRINTLKTTCPRMLAELKERRIAFREVPCSAEALILEGIPREELGRMDLIKDGLLYCQSLSSMLPALVLGPAPGERVLDLCAAPGSKTTQMAALMNNEGEIVAVEAVRQRSYKLRVVIEQTGAANVALTVMDGRRFKSERLFDKILVDAPCSSEGRFHLDHPKTCAYWSLRKIREMARKQKGLLLSASRLLKPGGVMVYSTCTFAPEENEGAVDWLLRKTQGALDVEAVDLKDIPHYPCLPEWRGKVFDSRVQKCLRVLPEDGMEGFFITKFVKAI